MDNEERKKILVVDDDPLQLSIVEKMLKTEYDVCAVKSALGALEFLYGGLVPHLILLDILMPDMDGWEAYNRIRMICYLRNVPIVFVTSLTGINEEKRGLEMGAADYIKKPYTQADLLQRITSAIQKNEKVRCGAKAVPGSI